MDQSPPKRVTRARAAAKTTDTDIKTARIATAASKAKATRNAAPPPPAKRKTRSEANEEDELQQEPQGIIEPKPRANRSRPKKAANPDSKPEQQIEEAPAQPKPARGRPKKAVVELPAAEPARTTRGRVKKFEVSEEEALEELPKRASRAKKDETSGQPVVMDEPPKRATRGRVAPVTKPAVHKKSVKFQDPDKENDLPPPAKGKKVADVTTGLRAKPMRKPATAETRATRGRAATVNKPTPAEEQKSSPLSPKKVTQVGVGAKGQSSDDELAHNEKTPMRPLLKSPVKAPGSNFGIAKKLDFSTSITAHKAITNVTQDLKGSMMDSPARRPVPSPFKEGMNSSPQKAPMAGLAMLKSPFKFSLPTPKTMGTSSPFKPSMLQSPARRPSSPSKDTENGSPTRPTSNMPLFAATPKVSTFKISRFATPRAVNKDAMLAAHLLAPSVEAAAPDANTEPVANLDSLGVPVPELAFTGRLSTIVPREADPTTVTLEPMVEGDIDEIIAVEVPEAEAMKEPMSIDGLKTTEATIEVEESIEMNAAIAVEDPMETESYTLSATPSRATAGVSSAFGLRETAENPFYESDSEDELASMDPRYSPLAMASMRSSASAPTFAAISKTPKTAKTQRSPVEGRSEREENLGFTPLARQLSDWMAASPTKSVEDGLNFESSPSTPREGGFSDVVAPEPSPAKSTFFDDEMSIRDELSADPSLPMQERQVSSLLEDEFEASDVTVDEEDLALAAEADEMSLLDYTQIQRFEPEDMFSVSEPTFQKAIQDVESHEAPGNDDRLKSDELGDETALSEASQEYGDENATPIDPALLSQPMSEAAAPSLSPPSFATPKRVLTERTYHTVSKVALKAPAEHTPMRPSPLKRSASIGKLPTQRPASQLSRKNTVISYSPTKGTPRSSVKLQPSEDKMQDNFATPVKANTAEWSTLNTPARTPRRDLNPALLKGAVVFVDVHTTEGADAGVLFIELLTEMGARCVKTWSWNGSPGEGSKIGITHVVYKDGGKKTLEKVKSSNGVVTCVGVGWVLDCERENQWLDEAPYSVDTSSVPRGGGRRRKSMEPRALANLNGTLTPARKSYGGNISHTPVTSKSRRRESMQWIHTRSSVSGSSLDGEASGGGGHDADQIPMLSPLPVTPVSGTYAYGGDGLGGYDVETPDGQTPFLLRQEQLLQKTAPAAKGRFFVDSEQPEEDSVIGDTFLSEKKDESVMMRLMAARRKSLQWAPKVGSPLARGGL